MIRYATHEPTCQGNWLRNQSSHIIACVTLKMIKLRVTKVCFATVRAGMQAVALLLVIAHLLVFSCCGYIAYQLLLQGVFYVRRGV